MDNRYLITPFFLDEPLSELKLLGDQDWQVNAPLLSADTEQERLSIIHRSLAALVAETIKDGLRPVSIAGDCCTAIGVLAGLQRAEIKPTLIWFDAHGDFNTFETTPSGFLGGMPLAMLVGRGEQRMPRAVGLVPIEEDHVILTDGRDLDPGEREAVLSSSVHFLPAVTMLLDYHLPTGPLFIHFDTDIINPAEVPAQNYPAKGGPSSSVVRDVFRKLHHSEQIAAVSVSTWNPKLDLDGRSKEISMTLLAELLKE